MNVPYQAAYIKSCREGILKDRVHTLRQSLQSCTLCPRNCRADRLSGETGICRTAEHAMVASYSPHFGEEPPLVGRNGSGTIFFTHCNLLCLFCQNFDISHQGAGRAVSDRDLADMMLSLQAMGCHNINFVSPSHVVPQILSALLLATEDGLEVPLVYNTGGYDLVDTLSMLDGIIDIYMPDMKFTDSQFAGECCQAPDYPEVMKSAVAEMHRQVGDLRTDQMGIAVKGLLVRHLVMPGRLSDTEEIIRFLAGEISRDTYLNIMPQYRPCGRAAEIRSINQYPSQQEFIQATETARARGLHRLD